MLPYGGRKGIERTLSNRDSKIVISNFIPSNSTSTLLRQVQLQRYTFCSSRRSFSVAQTSPVVFVVFFLRFLITHILHCFVRCNVRCNVCCNLKESSSAWRELVRRACQRHRRATDVWAKTIWITQQQTCEYNGFTNSQSMFCLGILIP